MNYTFSEEQCGTFVNGVIDEVISTNNIKSFIELGLQLSRADIETIATDKDKVKKTCEILRNFIMSKITIMQRIIAISKRCREKLNIYTPENIQYMDLSVNGNTQLHQCVEKTGPWTGTGKKLYINTLENIVPNESHGIPTIKAQFKDFATLLKNVIAVKSIAKLKEYDEKTKQPEKYCNQYPFTFRFPECVETLQQKI